MAILKREFGQHERGTGDQDWFSLARDTATQHVFIYHEWSHRRGDGYESGNADIELGTFLHHSGGTVQDRFRQLSVLWLRDRWPKDNTERSAQPT
jgi:hypothetical protein